MERQTGQTTRLVDKYIQDLFTIGFITPKDHHIDEDKSGRSDERLLRLIVKRIKSEHPHIKFKSYRKDYLSI